MTHPQDFGQKFSPIRRFLAWKTNPFWPHIPNMTQYGSAPRDTGWVKKYTRFTSHNTASTASILQIRFELDSWDFKLDYDIIKVHFTSLLIKLLMHKLTASFWKSTEIGPN